MRSSSIALVALLLLGSIAGAEELDQFGETQAWRGDLGEVTVIDFAATWCGPCWRTLPKLVSLAAEKPNLRVLVVSVDDQESGRDYLVERLGLELPVVWDRDHAIAEHYRPVAMPATFVVDDGGEVIYSHSCSGEAEWEALSSFLEDLGTAD